MKLLIRFLEDETGATAIEYGLIVAIVSITGVIASTMAGKEVSMSFSHISSTLTSANR